MPKFPLLLFKIYFLSSLAFASSDLLMLAFSGYYRGRVGAVRSVTDYSITLLPAMLLTLFFGAICLRLFRGMTISRNVVVAQSMLFSLLAIIMCVPFGGYFFAGLTPISIIYFTSVLLWPIDSPYSRYWFVCGVALLYVLLNTIIAILAIWKNVGNTKPCSMILPPTA